MRNWFAIFALLIALFAHGERGCLLMNDATLQWEEILGDVCIHYPFGDLTFETSDIATLTFPQIGEVELTTREGNVYRGPHKQIPDLISETVDLVYLATCAEHTREDTYTLQLKTGESFPVTVPSAPLHLCNGLEDFVIDTSACRDFAFEGCLQGVGIDQEGNRHNLAALFAKDPFLMVRLWPFGQIIKLPWDQIASISKGVTPNRIQMDPPPEVVVSILSLDEVNEALELLGLVFEEDLPTEEGHDIEELMEFPDFVAELPSNVHPVMNIPLEEFDYEEDFEYRLLPPGAEDAILEYDPSLIAEAVPEKSVEERAREVVEALVEEKMILIPQVEGKGGGFLIAPRKVTNRDYECFLEATQYRPPPHWIGGKIPVGEEHQPVVNICYKDALVYAVWSGKRLPTLDEWRLGREELQDAEDQTDEWTTTAYAAPNHPKRQIAMLGKKGRGGCRVVVRRNGETLSMHNHERNTHTGFRCVVDE